MKMKLTSFGLRAEVDFDQKFRYQGKPPYLLLEADGLTNDGSSKKLHRIVRKGDSYEATTAIGREKSTRKLDLDYTLLDALASELWIRTAPKVGDKLVYKDFDVEEAEIDEATATMMADKVSLVKGVKVRFFEVKSRSKRNPIDMLARHDEKGQLLSGNFSIFEIRSEPEDQAKNTQYSADLFVLGMAKVDRPLGEPEEITALVLEVVGEEGKDLPSGPRQSWGEKGGKRLLKLGKRHGEPVKANEKDVADNLKETSEYPLSNPRIKALAAKVVGNAKTDEEKVKRIVRYVHKFVRPSLSATLPNIFDLLERKRGDCKSYALLFNVLARAAGVPAREVSGLLYVGDDTKAFGGHAWNEVILNGEWVPIDASMGETEVNATHIYFGDQNQSVANLLSTLGKLSFRVVEIERGN
jgi:hypothetical protein